MRDKYANKSLPMQIFHRYTGVIVVSVFLAIVIPIYYYYDSQQFFFESWSCEMVDQSLKKNFEYSQLSEQELERFKEIVTECKIVHDWEN